MLHPPHGSNNFRNVEVTALSHATAVDIHEILRRIVPRTDIIPVFGICMFDSEAQDI